MFFFFFSSRRRHTRLQGDWSSDVCSSDLASRETARRASARRVPVRPSARAARSEERRVGKECRSRWSPNHYKKKKEHQSRRASELMARGVWRKSCAEELCACSPGEMEFLRMTKACSAALANFTSGCT